MMNVIMKNVIMMNVVMMNVVMLSVVMLNVIMLSVVAPKKLQKMEQSTFFKYNCDFTEGSTSANFSVENS